MTFLPFILLIFVVMKAGGISLEAALFIFAVLAVSAYLSIAIRKGKA